jgi:hypothetical protein
MKKLALVLSLAMVIGVFSANAQEKKVAPKKATTEQQEKKPTEKKEVKKEAKISKPAGAVKSEKKEAAKK